MKGTIGVHETHCCVVHGCKYGDEDCPVVLGKIKQKYICESCDDDWVFVTEDLIWVELDKKFEEVKNQIRVKKIERLI